MSVRLIDPRSRDFNYYAGGGDPLAQIATRFAEEVRPKVLRSVSGQDVISAVEATADRLNISPAYGWMLLFNGRLWPRSLSEKNVASLYALRALYESGGAPSTPWMRWGGGMPEFRAGISFDDADPVEVIDLNEEFLMSLAVFGRRWQIDLGKIVLRHAQTKVSEVQAACEESLGEPCSDKDALGILVGDLRALSRYGRLKDSRLFSAILSK